MTTKEIVNLPQVAYVHETDRGATVVSLDLAQQENGLVIIENDKVVSVSHDCPLGGTSYPTVEALLARKGGTTTHTYKTL